MTSEPAKSADGNREALSLGAVSVARGLRRTVLAPVTVSSISMCLDAVSLGLGVWISRFQATSSQFDPWGSVLHAALAAFAVVMLVGSTGAYRLGRLRRFWRGVPPLMLLGLAIAYLNAGEEWSIVAVAIFALPARALGAAMAGAALDFGLTERRAVLVGGGEAAARVMKALADAQDSDIRVVGIFDDRDDLRSPIAVAGVPKLGSVETLLSFARTAEIDMLIITLPLTAEERIRSILKMIEVLPLDVRLADISADPTFRRHAGTFVREGLISVMSRPIAGGRLALKRAVDVLGASVALMMFAPVMVLVAIAIRLESPGPIFFRQERHGYNNRPITVWKFRSMYAADCDPEARRIVTRQDARVTRVGRIIRKTSLDELPQLLNVLKGDLSLVGPRPHALRAISSRQEPFEAIVAGYAARHRVRPGITGWAQINGWRGEINDPEALRRRVEHDLYYIENWSIGMDLYVLMMTPLRLLNTKNAY